MAAYKCFKCGKSGINVRHSLLELNWHLPVADEESLALKKFIVMNFDQNDISTYGLTFAITKRGTKKIYFTSIVIEKNEIPNIVKNFKVRPTYNVLYSENFDSNSQSYLVYAQDVDKIELPGLLMELSKLYFEELKENDKNQTKKPEQLEIKSVYQCDECMTVYDADFGDINRNIEPGIKFEDLPDTYTCPVCAASKKSYKRAQI